MSHGDDHVGKERHEKNAKRNHSVESAAISHKRAVASEHAQWTGDDPMGGNSIKHKDRHRHENSRVDDNSHERQWPERRVRR
jgi:hypothetical protein